MIYELLKDKIKITNSCPQEVKEVYEFIINHDLHKYVDDFTIDDLIKKKSIFSSITKTQAINLVRFFDNNNFNKENFECEDETILNNFKSTFFNVKYLILLYLDEKFTLNKFNYESDFVLTLPVSPPAIAYKKVGNNNLDIKPSGRDYGLLFR